MKYKNYVGVLLWDTQSKVNVIKYVTRVHNDGKMWFAKDGEPAKAFCLSFAKDLVYGMTCNGTPAVVVTAPSYLDLSNPEKGDEEQ